VLLGFPRLVGPVIKINHVLGRLVAVSIIAHFCNLHFSDFMDAVTIVAVIINRRHDENRIEHSHELIIAAYGLFQPSSL